MKLIDLHNTIGVDVHFKSNHMILIFSKLNGQLRHIDVGFNTLQELNNLVKHLKKRYGTNRCFVDSPYPNEYNWR